MLVKMKALVVNGCTEERRALVAALARLEGVDVQCALSDLATAIRVLRRFTPDLLVIGTELADGDGIRLVEWARRRGMLIVVVGPAPSRDVWRRYLQAGADRFVEPDPDHEELSGVVRELVRRAGAGRLELPPRATDPLAADIATELNDLLHVIEEAFTLLERSPGDGRLWTESRAALEQVVCLAGMLLGQVCVRDPQAPAVAGAQAPAVARARPVRSSTPPRGTPPRGARPPAAAAGDGPAERPSSPGGTWNP